MTMIGSLLFLPASLLAAQITISEVTAERDGGRVAITVKGDAMIDPETTSAKVGEGRLYLFVHDAHVRENNRAWKNDVADGADEIRAHRHKQRVELAIPLGDDGCQGPVELEKAAGGLRALVACEGGPRPRAARSSRAAVAPATTTAGAEVAKPESRVTVLPAASSPTAVKPEALGAALKAKLSLDPEPPAKPAKAANAVPASASAGKPAVAAAKPASAPSASAWVSASASGVSPTPTLTPTPTAGSGASPTPPGPAAHDALAASSSTPNSGVFLGGGALLALAAAAFYFSRRRATGRERHIQILETASLGPKRALVVARVGDATMILGSSEAGITLLQSVPDIDASKQAGGGIAVPELSFAPIVNAPAALAAAAGSTPAPKIIVEEAPSSAPIAVVPIAGTNNTWSLDANGLPAIDDEITGPPLDTRAEPQDGLLSRLFKRGTPANDYSGTLGGFPNPPAKDSARQAELRPRDQPRFEDILEDSFEDQELRRKLALGLPGRVR
jgi:flagellar protein FliO/FliZ